MKRMYSQTKSSFSKYLRLFTRLNFRLLSLGIVVIIQSHQVLADTPVLTASPPAESFVGETFCFDAGLTNTGSNGFGPYYQVITQPGYTLSSASFIGVSQAITNVGTFPSSPANQLLDPVSEQQVTGPDGGQLSVVRYPVSSVVVGQPSLEMNLCFSVDASEPINVLQADAFELVPGYEFGDTATGDNGPSFGARTDFDFTPVVILYSLSDVLAEMENPPGPAWTWNIDVVADIAADRTVTPIDFSTVSPITLPSNVQFVGPVTFSGSGVSCTATTPVSPPPENPGGSVTLSCASGSGTIGVDQDITATFPVYIVDTLDETTCSTQGAINTAKHLTIRKSSSGSGLPGSTVTYTIDFQVSEFVSGIDRLEVTDILPDGLTYVSAPTVSYNGSGAVSITPLVSNDSPGLGQTTVTYDVTPVTGTLAPASSGVISYTATIDQTYDAAPLAGEPLRSRDVLSSTVSGEYDIVSGAASCSDDSSESITVPDVSSGKSIVGSAVVQAGDSITWRLRLDIPSGDVQGIVFNDYFPLPVFDVDSGTIGIDTTTTLASNPDIAFGPNDTLGIDPTAISVNGAENRLTIVWPDVVSTTGEVIEVDISIEVSDDPFSDGLVLSNIFQAVTNNSVVDGIAGLNIADITVQAPSLSITKTVTSSDANLEAGDTVAFDIVVTNDGSAEAYDVVVTDTAPAQFTGCSLGGVTGGSGAGDVFAAGYTFASFSGVSATALDPGDSVTLPISCTLATTANNNTTYENTAAVVWAAQLGATAFPSVEDSDSVATRQTEAFKEIVTTSESHTDDTTADTSGDPRPVVTGEIIRYRMWAYLPQGTTAGVTLNDLLPDGLAYVAGSQTLLGLVSDSGTAITAAGLSCSSGSAGRSGNELTDFSTLGLDCVVSPSSGGSGSGSNPQFALGDIVNSEDDANEELVLLEFNARVVGDQATGTSYDNRFRLVSSNGNSTSDSVYAQQVAPQITIDKVASPTTADANDTVEYVVTFQHSTSTGDEVAAFDVSFNDVIQSGLTYDSGTGVTGPQPPAVPGTDTCTASSLVVNDSDPTGAGITITFDQLAPGDVCEVRYLATTDAAVLPGQTITNTVDLDYTSLPGSGTVTNPTGSAPGTEASLQSQDSATVTINAIDINKTIVSTSVAATSDTTADTAVDPRPVAIGESVTYRLQMQLPEGNAPAYQVTDFLPSGLQYVAGSGRIAFVFNGAGSITPTPGITCASGTLNQNGNETTINSITPTCVLDPSGGPFNSGTDPIWALGSLSNTDMDADDEFVVIEFSAQVVNESGNQDGQALANNFELSVNGVADTSASVFAEVVEPQLTLTSAHSADPVDNRLNATPSFSWDVVLTNAGSAAAYQIDSDSGGGWELVLPVGVQNISSLTLTPTGDVFLNGTTTTVTTGNISLSTTNNTNDTLTFSSPMQMAAGASLLLEFDASLLATVEPGDTPTNTEELVYASTVSGDSSAGIRDDADQASGTGNAPITSTTQLNDYRTEVALSVATTPENPALSTTKSITTGPVNQGDGTFTLTYTIDLANTGDVNLETVVVADNLDTTFGAGTYTVEDVRVSSDSSSLAENTSFTGNGVNTALLLSTSTLPSTESGSIEIDLTVTPGANLGPLTNTAVGTSVSERTGADANNNGTVDLTFDEGAEIGLAKTISAGPTNNNDGTYTLSYTFNLENSGDITLDGLQITDNLATVFASANSYVVDSVTSSDFTVDSGYDGTALNADLLTGVDSLAAGASGSVVMQITVTPGATLGPYNNSAVAAGDPPSNNTVNDTSDNGIVADGNGNSDPSDDSDATPVTFTESPQIGAAKQVLGAVTNNNDGTYSLTYRILLENFGDVPLQRVQVIEDLASTFASADSFSVDGVTSSDFTVNSPSFDGDADTDLLTGVDTLAVGATGTIDLALTVTPGTTLGPYNNVVSAQAEGPGGTATSDASDAGSDPDGNGNSDPSDDSDPTSLTFTEAAQLGLAKRLLASPTNNGDGSFTLTYRFVVENSGDVPINSVAVTDDLATTFASANSFTVDNVTSSDFSVNFPGYNGDTDTSLLDGTDALASGGTGSIDVMVTVVPGTTLGPYSNSASTSATSSGGAILTDTSDNGSVADGNGNSDPSDDSDATPVTFVENPEIGLAKTVQAGVTNNNDGTYTLTYRLLVENSGDSPLNSLQISDDLSTAFSGASFSVDAVSSSDFTVNFPGFNGDTDQNLLNTGNTLATGATGVVDMTVTVTPGTNLGPYNNTASTTANAPGGGVANDISDFGTDPDGNGNDDPTDDSDVTPLTFIESPQIGLAKAIASGPVNNLDGSYTLTYRLFLENSGDVPVSAVQITDDLNTTFAGATGFTVDNLSSADFSVNFPGFNGTSATSLLVGSDGLAVGASGTVDMVITVTPGTNLGPYNNSAAASAMSSGGNVLNDTSHTGSTPDGNGNSDPSDDSTSTAVTFVEGPAVTVSKALQAGPTNNNDGTYTLTYRITATNSGDTPLSGIEVSDDISAAFAAADSFTIDNVSSPTLAVNFPGFDGLTAGDTNLLEGTDTLTTSGIGSSGDIDVTLTVTPGAVLGSYVNAASAQGTSPSSATVNDTSNAPNVNFVEDPEIGLAKAITAGPTNNADGTYSLSYTLTLTNSGDVPLTAVQVVDDLSTSFALATGFSVDSVTPSAGLTANNGFDGVGDTNLLSGSDSLAVSQTETIVIAVTLTPGNVLGPYNNNASISGSSPSAAVVNDVSANGLIPDANGNSDPSDDSMPTAVTFAESPEIGLAKALAGPPVNNGDGTYTLSYTLTVENSGDVIANNLQITDDLSVSFAGAIFTVDSLSSTDFSVNFPGYNGIGDTNLLAGTNSLLAGTTGTLSLNVTVTPGSNLGPYDNTSVLTGSSPAGSPLSDDSFDGLDPDGNGNNDPSDDASATSVTFSEAPQLGLAKAVAAPLNNGDGSYDVLYTLTLQNSGDVELRNLQITDALGSVFAGADAWTVNNVSSSDFTVNFPGFDGTATQTILAGSDTLNAGASGTVTLSVTVTPGANLGPFNNTANTTASSPAGAALTDVSHLGNNPDGNGNGDPTDDSSVTPVSFVEVPEIGLAKQIVTGPVNNADGTHTLGYRFLLANTGDVVLSNVQLVDDLSTAFGAASSFVVDSVSSTDFSVASSYNGTSQVNMLNGTDTLSAGASGFVDMTVTVIPGTNLGPYANSATVAGVSPATFAVNDLSDDAAVVDRNGNGDPSDDSQATNVTFLESPLLGIAKALTVGPTNNGDGSYSLSYTFTVENSGDVNIEALNISEDLATIFGGASAFSVDAVGSTTLTINPSFNGVTDTQLLTGSDVLAVGATENVVLTMTVIPGANLGPYLNTVTVLGTTPAGIPVNDVSADGTDPDANGNGDPSDDAATTAVNLSEQALLGIAKQASDSTPNYDGTFTSTITLLVENLGDVIVNGVVISDDIATQIDPATVEAISNVRISGALTALDVNFDGVTNTRLTTGAEALAVGQSATVEFDLTFRPNDNLGPFSNIAQVVGESPANATPGTPNVQDDSTVGTVTDPNGNGDPTDDNVPTLISFTAGTNGTVTITEESVPGELITVTVDDSDENFDPLAIESFDVLVSNDTNGETEVITLVETGPNTGVFTAQLATTFGTAANVNDDGTLTTQLNDAVTVTYTDRLTATGGALDRTDTGVVIGFATIEGNAWLDLNTDDTFDIGEAPLADWVIRVEQNGVFVTEVPVNADGSYQVPDLLPGAGYTINLIHPDSDVTFGTIGELELMPEITVVDQNLAIDPSGVFYDSTTRDPVAGVTVTMINSSGTPLPTACLLAGQQDQQTAADGFYRFDVIADATSACPSNETYTLVFSAPSEYSPGISALLPPLSGPLDPTGLGNPLRVGDSATAPTLAESTDYYVSFTLASGDPDVIFNHIPLDPVGVGGFSVRLTKEVNRPSTTIGGLVPYTITIENLSPITLPGISVIDSLPAGFSYVEGSARLENDSSGVLSVSGTRPVTFAGIDLPAGERRTLSYILRVGVGVTQGEYINTATPFVGPAQIGNSDQASVVLVADPDFEQTSIIGKVWHDRDADGWQDRAEASQLKITAELAEPTKAIGMSLHLGGEALSQIGSLSEGLLIEQLPGRYGPADNTNANRLVVKARYPGEVSVQRLRVQTEEGTDLIITADGHIEDASRGDKARGLTSQDLQVSFKHLNTENGYELVIIVTNAGLAEPGIPGVRLATVEGLLIETDAYGRYHIAGVDAGFFERGRNFIVKLDAATLPDKAELTTENPRVKRLSQGLMNRFDFGVTLNEPLLNQQVTKIKVAEMFFKPGSAEVLPEYIPSLRALAKQLDRGHTLNLTLQAYLDDNNSYTEASALAQQRAVALQAKLSELLGRDISDQLTIKIEPVVIQKQKVQQQSNLGDKLSALSYQLLEYVVNALIPAAHADCTTLSCQSAVTDGALVLEQASVYPKVSELRDQGRVDVIANTTLQLADGGVIWWTEDPAAPIPRLVVQGPSHLPLRQGRFINDAEFIIHSNYAHFHDSLSLEVFAESDTDRRVPVARFDIDTRNDKRLFYPLRWSLEKQGNLASESSLVYRVKATNSDGLVDTTSEFRIFTIDADLYDLQLQQAEALVEPYPELTVSLIDDYVVVFVPGIDELKASRFRPQFEELSTNLSASDRDQLDAIIAQFAQARDVNINVVGHASSEGIAKRSQHLFKDNYELSRARADAVAEYVITQLGENVNARRTDGRGADVPIMDNAQLLGRIKNRRADITIEGMQEIEPAAVHLVNRADGSMRQLRDGDDLVDLNAASDQIQPVHLKSNVDSGFEKLLAPTAQSMHQLMRRNDIVQRRIPVYGSRMRIQGKNLGTDYQVRLNQELIPLDRNNSFATEYVLPVGSHTFDLAVSDGVEQQVNSQLNADITGKYQFIVALADITVSSHDVSGSIEPLSGNERYQEDILTEGRLAFYLKGKIKGKYLLTAQMDTREQQLDEIFSGIHRKDPDSLFRRLDPDHYYPVYGDDSTTVADVNTQGRMYVRLEWDRSDVVWGNYETGFTGNELGQYSRGLYGAKATYDSLEVTAFDDSKTHISGFVSEAQTALGHSEFLGTGGSLYYLRHRDVLPGSDKLRIEIRDPDTNRVIDQQTLTREIDYEIDEIQGRVILSKPLLQTSEQSAPSLITDGPLDGNITVLIADYEYLPDNFDPDNLVTGLRGKHWFGDHVALGATYVDEGRDTEDYQLGGVDVTLKAEQNSWAKLEWATTKATQTERLFSTDGGLSFSNLSPLGIDDRQGDAYSLDVHVNAGDFGGSDRWVSNVWFKSVDDQYSVARRDDGTNIEEYGFETQLPLSDQWLLGVRGSYFDVSQQYELTELAIQTQGQLGDRGKLDAELKSTQEKRNAGTDADATLLAVQYEHSISKSLDVYGRGQAELSSGGDYQDNNQIALGAKLAFSHETSGHLEVRDGDRGNGLIAGMEHRLNKQHVIYGTMTHSTDNTQDPFARDDNGASMLDNVGTNFAAGHRWALNDRTNLFSEMQFSRNDEFASVGEVFGLDYASPKGWHMGFTLQEGTLDTDNGIVDRQAYSGFVGYQSKLLKASTRLEYRKDEGADDIEQWLTTNRLDYKLSPTYRIATKLNYSESTHSENALEDAKLIEGSIGLARRSHLDNRFNWLAKYTYLYDLHSAGQIDQETDQRSHIIAWEGIYRLNKIWDFGSKIARRVGELRLARNSGPWFKSSVNFASLRARWHLLNKWDAMGEYRWLQQREAENERAGYLLSVSRHVAKHFKVGVGYNFTDFSDDLTDLDYDHKGWFLNLVGKY